MQDFDPDGESATRRVPLDIYHLIAGHAERNPDGVAIGAPGRPPLSFCRLLVQTESVVKTLNSMGVGRNDRVAIVLPNGPEMGAAFLAVAAGATSVPLNPAFRANEFDFYLSDLNAKALVIQSGFDSPALAVARERAIPVIELAPVLDAEAGIFTLSGHDQTQPALGGFAQPDDVALVLHTSGTTSRPKIVPLTHTNILTSACNIRRVLGLVETDRCLNVMPLFHIHGLIGAVLSSLTAGSNVVCTPGFQALKFFEWMAEFQPTWYTAVPTVHQAVLAHAGVYREAGTGCPLRFVRSSSSALPPRVMAELEEMLGVPVIESYGMTEASHQIASNPLPPAQRKPGSVGLAAGPEIAIIDETGNFLPEGKTGEIVIRGPSVILGYESNPDANKSAFVDRWFRTGDLGYFDRDGYLFITGRLKEIINRGGEKISPREVDEVLVDHPAVAEAVTFAVPHATLSEDVAAAVVLRQSAFATEKEIREFASARLAPYKVPSQVLIVERMPKGATGKVQRIGLAEKFAPQLKPEFVPPGDQVENALARIWAEILGIQRVVGIRDNFFALGGDSLRAAALFARIQEIFGKKLPLATLFQAPTVEQLADILGQEQWSAPWSSLVAIQPKGSKPPFFCVHGPGGHVLNYSHLASRLGEDQPFYGLQALGLDGKQPPDSRIEDMATHYVKEIRSLWPNGPYFLGGFCFGGQVAFEIARQLEAQGLKVALLALFEAYVRRYPKSLSDIPLPSYGVYRFVRNIVLHMHALLQLRGKDRSQYVLRRIWNAKTKLKMSTWKILNGFFSLINVPLPNVFSLRDLYLIHCQAGKDYMPQPYPGRVTVFVVQQSPEIRSHDPRLAWGKLAAGGMEIHEFPGSHDEMLTEPQVRLLAEELRACLTREQESSGC